MSRKVSSGASGVGNWYSREKRVQGRKPWPISASSAPVRYLMMEVLPLCVLPNSQNTGTGVRCAQPFQLFLEPGFAFLGGKEPPQFLQHGIGPSGTADRINFIVLAARRWNAE